MAPKPLPKTSHPTFPILVPTLKRAGRFRPFTVKEEKILLMARESNKPIDHLRAVYQIVTNCIEDPTVNSSELTTFDLDWLFTKITASSVREKVTQSFNDIEEREKGLDPLPVYTFDIKLDDIQAPVIPDDVTGVISLSDGSAVHLKYSPAVLYTDEAFVDAGRDAVLYHSTNVICSANGEIYKASDYTLKEIIEFYDGFKLEDMEKVNAFLASTPSMLWETKYTNSLGNEREIKLTALTDFFTF